MSTGRSRLAPIFLSIVPLLSGVIGFILNLPVMAQQPSGHGAPTYRFDFETDVDRDGLPDYWKVVAGGHDPLNPNGKLVGEDPHSGKLCFAVTPDGASTNYETTDTFGLDGRFTWRLSAWARTTELSTSGVRASSVCIEAVLLDETDKVVQTLASERVTGTTNGWQQLVVEIPPAEEGAPRKVRIALVLDGRALTGKVWFDDMVLRAQPTIELNFAGRGRVLTSGDEAVCRVELATLVESEYRLQVMVAGPEGSKAFDKTFAVTPDAKCRATIKVELPLRVFGLYRVNTRLTNDRVEEANREVQVGYVPAPVRGSGGGRGFGVMMNGTDAGLEAMASTLGSVGVGRAFVRVWGPGQREEDLARSAGRLDPVLAQLRSDGVQPVLVLAGVPQEIGLAMLAQGLAPDESRLTVARLLSADARLWLKPLSETAERFGRRTGCWQLGGEPDLAMSEQMPAQIRSIFSGKLAGLAPEWKVGVPVSMEQSGAVIRAAQEMDFVVFVPGAEASARDVSKKLAMFRTGRAERWLEVTIGDESRVGQERQLGDMVERAALARAAGVTVIVVKPSTELFERDGSPRDALLALGTLSRALNGMDYAGDLSAQADVHLPIFRGGGRTTAIFWGEESRGTWSGYLGGSAKRVDLWGNVSALTEVNGVVTLKAGKLPFIVTDIDGEKITIQRSTQEGVKE